MGTMRVSIYIHPHFFCLHGTECLTMLFLRPLIIKPSIIHE